MDNQTYINNEIARHRRHVCYVAAAPLSDRQAGRADYAAATVEHIIEAAEHIAAGNFGAGVYHELVRNVVNYPRRNGVALLAQWVAAYEFACPPAFARQAYNGWDTDKRHRVNLELAKVIDAARRELATQSEAN